MPPSKKKKSTVGICCTTPGCQFEEVKYGDLLFIVGHLHGHVCSIPHFCHGIISVVVVAAAVVVVVVVVVVTI